MSDKHKHKHKIRILVFAFVFLLALNVAIAAFVFWYGGLESEFEPDIEAVERGLIETLEGNQP